MHIDEGGLPSGGSLAEYVAGRLNKSKQVARGRQVDIQPTISIDERMLAWPSAIRELFSRFRVRELLEEAKSISTGDKSLGILISPKYGLTLQRVLETSKAETKTVITDPGMYFPQTGPDRGGYAGKPTYGSVETGRRIPVIETKTMIIDAARSEPGNSESGYELFYSYHLHQVHREDSWSARFSEIDRQDFDMYLTPETRIQSPEVLKRMIGDQIVRERTERRSIFDN